MAIKREVTFTVEADGRVSPSAPQDGGVQGEHNATIVVFHVAEGSAWTDPDYAVYIECEDNAGNIDATEQLTVKEGAVSYLLPLAWTQYGGIATLRLVAEQLAVGGDIVRSPDATVRFSARQNAQDKVDGLMKGRLAQIEKRAGEAAASAEEHAKKLEEAVLTAENAATGAVTARDDAIDAEQQAKSVLSNAVEKAEQLVTDAGAHAKAADNAANAAEGFADTAEKAAELAMAQLGAKAAITGPNTVVFTQLDLSDLPAPPTYTTEKDDELSKDDGSGYHCVTLEKTETAFEYAEAGTELTVTTEGSKVWCVGDNRFPMTELVSSEPSNDGNRRLTVNDDGSITVRFYATIDLPFPLPAGYYAISATVVDFGYKENDAVVSNSYPRFDLRNADNTTAIASEYSYYADAAAWGRAGCILYASEPFSQIRIYSANGNNASGGAWATALESKLEDVCMMYYSSQPVRTRDIYTNRDYCGEIYDVADGKATITMPDVAKTVFAFDDDGNSVDFNVMYSYQKAAETPVAPDEPIDPEYHEAGELKEMAVGNRMFRSFRDVTAQRDAAEARRIAGEAQKAAPPAATAADNGKVLKVVDGKTVWAEDAVGAAELPAATAADNGKVLKMVDGKTVWAEDAVGGTEAPAGTEFPTALAVEMERVQTESMETGVNTDLSLLVFADPHSFAEEYAWGDPYHFHPYKYEKYAKMMENPAVDFMLCLGDINPYGDHTKSRCIEGMQKILTVSGKEPNRLYVPGNHDVVVGYGGPTLDNTLTKEEQHTLLCSHLTDHVQFDPEDPYGCHYYVDYEASKIRIIVLNATDVWNGEVVEAGNNETTICMRQAQMDWFTDVALDLTDKDGWSVLVCVHTIALNTKYKTELTRILSAVKNGGSVSITDNPRFTVNKSYATQGARGVIGVFFGHGHQDELYESNGIKCLQFGTDNAHVDESYIAALGEDGLAAGDYYIETRNGTRFGRSFNDYPDARYVTFNNYIGGSVTWWNLLDADKNVITYGYAYPEGQTGGYTPDMPPIAVRWTPRRVEGTATTESCYIVNIDKTAGTITKLPYGVGEHRVIQYR